MDQGRCARGLHLNGGGADAITVAAGDHVAASAQAAPGLVVGQGSSAGAGAALRDPLTDAPVAYFTRQLNALLSGVGLDALEATNKSVGGSTLYDGNQLTNTVILPLKPDILFDAFGMNDGGAAQFYSGETLPGAEAALRARIADLQAAGVAVVLTTTPHPHVERRPAGLPPGSPIVYPTFIADPTPADYEAIRQRSLTQIDWMGSTITVSTTYLAVNDMIRRVAHDTGAVLIDVETFWFDAETRYSQDALYDAGEFVHPNLLGH